MSGAYQLAMSRATATEHHDGVPTGRTWGPGTVTVRGGVAVVKQGHQRHTVAAGTPVREHSGRYVVPITAGPATDTAEAVPEGTTWVVTKSCGCGG